MNSILTFFTTSTFSVLAFGLWPASASAHGPEHAILSVGVLAGGGMVAQPLAR